jgi:hypothetical protein
MRHGSPEEIGFYPQCEWTFCTEEAQAIMFADVSNGEPQGKQQQQMIYACSMHVGMWAKDLGISDDCIEQLDNYISF